MITNHVDLPAKTVVRDAQTGYRYRVLSMHGTFAHVRKIRNDGGDDQRHLGWSGSLPLDRFEIERVSAKAKVVQ